MFRECHLRGQTWHQFVRLQNFLRHFHTLKQFLLTLAKRKIWPKDIWQQKLNEAMLVFCMNSDWTVQNLSLSTTMPGLALVGGPGGRGGTARSFFVGRGDRVKKLVRIICLKNLFAVCCIMKLEARISYAMPSKNKLFHLIHRGLIWRRD